MDIENTNNNNDIKEETRENDIRPPPPEDYFDFENHTLDFSFHDLIKLIRMFLVLCIFYMFLWIFRDRNADIRSTGQLFSLYNSAFCSIFSIYYYFTKNINSAIFIIASFFSSLLADCYYGYFHYHHIMCKPNGYLHHFIYLGIFLYAYVYHNYIGSIALFSLAEIPSLILNVKQVFQIDSLLIQISILVSFLVFRVLWWAYLMYKNTHVLKKNIPSGIVSSLALFLHIQWTITHAYKTWNYTKR